MRLFLLSLILLTIISCDSSDNKPQQTLSEVEVKVKVSALPGYLTNAQQVAVYDANGGAFVKEITLSPDEAGLTLTAVSLVPNRSYRLVLNPNNKIIEIRCPLVNGCYEYSQKSVQIEAIAYGQPLGSQIQLSAIIQPQFDTELEINITTDLAARLVQSSYVSQINAATINQAQSVIANIFGLVGHSEAFNHPQQNSWNQRLNQAINAGLLFDERKVILNASSTIAAVYNLLGQTLMAENKLGQLNEYFLADAVKYLQDIALSSSLSRQQKLSDARLRAYLLAKNIYPSKGFLPSPYIHDPDIATGKRFLDDFRSLLYTFADDSESHHQVNNALSKGHQLITTFSQQILIDLFFAFNAVLSEVPLGSENGIYMVDGLNVEYNNDKLTWNIVGHYQQLQLNLVATSEMMSLNPILGNSFTIQVAGTVVNEPQQIRLDNANFELSFDLPDNPFFGIADGSGYIAASSNVAIQQQDSTFSGLLNARIELIAQQAAVVEILESASVYGVLTEFGQQHQLSLAIVHPDISAQTNGQFLADDAVISYSYSAPLQGLGEPLLTLFVTRDSIASGISVSDIDAIAYFEGRMSKFSFFGNPQKFTYQGMNQDAVSWVISVDKKEAAGEVNLNRQLLGTPRVLKDVAGVMYSDGNFISIF